MMKKPQVKELDMPEEVREAVSRAEEEPQLYYGMAYAYKYVLYPEKQGGILTLYWYDVRRAKEEQNYGTSYITYIDFEKEEWCTYLCREGRWSTAGFENLYRCSWGDRPSKLLILGSEYSIAQLKSWQQKVGLRRLKARQEEKDEKTNRMMEQARPLTDAYLEWHEKTVMKESRYLIYRRSGKKTFQAFCTHCGKHVEMPASACKNDKKSTCPSCGSRITMKSGGRTKFLVDVCWTEYVQAFDGGLMIRFVKMTKDYTEYGNPQRYVGEPSRVIIERGKGAVWYEIRESNTTFSSKSEYQRNNERGCIHGGNFPQKPYFGAVYRKGLESELKKAFPYNAFHQWLARSKKVLQRFDVYDYFDAYSRYPLIESLEKTGKSRIVDAVVKNTWTADDYFNPKAGTVSELLGITRQQYKKLKNPTLQKVRLCKLMRERDIELDVRTLVTLERYVSAYDIEQGRMDMVLEHTTFRQFMKYIAAQDSERFRMHYFDYLRMAKQLDYDLDSRFVLFPRNPEQAHDAAVDVLREKEEKLELQKASREDKNIMKTERRIRKQFTFEDEEYIIRPAKTNQEIVREGQTLHTCVGYAGYSQKMIEGTSYILFLRKKTEPQTPFYTVEITPEYEILQRHGKNNQEHEEVREVDRFLKKFVEVKKNGKKHHAGK